MLESEVGELAACKIDELRDTVGLGSQIIPAPRIREPVDDRAGSGVGITEREDRLLHKLLGMILKLVDLLGDAGDHGTGVVPASTPPPDMLVQTHDIRVPRHFPLRKRFEPSRSTKTPNGIKLIVAPAPHCGPAIQQAGM